MAGEVAGDWGLLLLDEPEPPGMNGERTDCCKLKILSSSGGWGVVAYRERLGTSVDPPAPPILPFEHPIDRLSSCQAAAGRSSVGIDETLDAPISALYTSKYTDGGVLASRASR
jgi:hypothetical protein